jgi:hypothetical protein
MPDAPATCQPAEFVWDDLAQYEYDDEELDDLIRGKLDSKHLYVQMSLDKSGSTNWSISGESEQDNQVTLSRNAVIASELRAVLDLNHDWMLKQMAEARTKAVER